MTTHIRLLGVLYVVWGGLGVVLGVALLLLGVGATALARAPMHEGTELAAGLTAVLLAFVGILLVGAGALSTWTGVALGERRPAARLAGLALALVNLFVFPLGTALGAYSFWVLLQNETRRAFEGDG
jgi:hypothetical protein